MRLDVLPIVPVLWCMRSPPLCTFEILGSHWTVCLRGFSSCKHFFTSCKHLKQIALSCHWTVCLMKGLRQCEQWGTRGLLKDLAVCAECWPCDSRAILADWSCMQARDSARTIFRREKANCAGITMFPSCLSLTRPLLLPSLLVQPSQEIAHFIALLNSVS